jgi:hypothetical protein
MLMNWWVLKRRPHVSWLIAIGCGALIVGVYVAQYVQPTLFSSLLWYATGIILLSIGLWRRYTYLIPMIIVAGFIIGLWRGSVQAVDLIDLQVLIGTNIMITGHVREVLISIVHIKLY